MNVLRFHLHSEDKPFEFETFLFVQLVLIILQFFDLEKIQENDKTHVQYEGFSTILTINEQVRDFA